MSGQILDRCFRSRRNRRPLCGIAFTKAGVKPSLNSNQPKPPVYLAITVTYVSPVT